MFIDLGMRVRVTLLIDYGKQSKAGDTFEGIVTETKGSFFKIDAGMDGHEYEAGFYTHDSAIKIEILRDDDLVSIHNPPSRFVRSA